MSTSIAPKTPKIVKTPQGDRFIPRRSAMDCEISHFNLTNENVDPLTPGSAKKTPSKGLYKSTLASTMLGQSKGPAKILTLQAEAPKPPEGHLNNMRVLYSQNKISDYSRKKPSSRYIPQAPEKILDAPGMSDDFYLNLLDWSSNNLLAVALGSTVYLWKASTGETTELCTMPAEDNNITSLSWVQDGNYLAVGNNNAEVQIWDVGVMRQMRSMDGHSARVGALAWNGATLTSGGRDGAIIHHDVRIAQHITAKLAGAHAQEVCGLRWSPGGTHLASGGNDNVVNIYDRADTAAPRQRLERHTAAVKALAWCPHQAGVLATGGGTADRRICLWNAPAGALLQEVDTESQVCGLLWNPHERELLSSHGFRHNQLTLWRYPSMTKVTELMSHQARVLHMAAAPDGTVVSAGADETLRFWRVFGDGSSASASAAAAGGRAGGKAAGTFASLARASSIR